MTSPILEGATDPTSIGASWVIIRNTTGWDFGTNSTSAHHGGRVTLSSPVDVSAYDYLYFEGDYTDFGSLSRIESLANGGLRVILIDGSGNWARYNFHGSEFPTNSDNIGWRDFSFVGGSRSPNIYVNLSRTPDASGGVIDFTDVTAIELHCVPASGSDYDFKIGAASFVTLPILTGGSVGSPLDFSEFKAAWASLSNNPFRAWQELIGNHSGIQGDVFSVWVAGDVGDGSTETHFSTNSGTLAFYPPNGSLVPAGPWVLLDDDFSRNINIIQSSLDSFSLTNYSLTCADDVEPSYSLVFSGSSSAFAVIDKCNFLACKQLVVGHATISDCIFTGGREIVVNLDSSVQSTVIRNTYPGGDGLRVVGGPGDYSNVQITVEDSVVISADSAGTYDLRGIRTQGQTINIEYEGSNTITVQLDPSVTATWSSTGGGTVIIDNATTVSVKATVKELDGTDIVGAQVYLEADSGGSLPAGASVTITRSGSTATVTHTGHGRATSDKITIRGSNQDAYNGLKTITVTDANTYTFTVSGTPTTPATGTITATSVILDGTTDADGKIEDASFVLSGTQPVTGTVRKSTTSPFFKPSPMSGSITISGFDATVFLTSDE
jgi:hypothetical protein